MGPGLRAGGSGNPPLPVFGYSGGPNKLKCYLLLPGCVETKTRLGLPISRIAMLMWAKFRLFGPGIRLFGPGFAYLAFILALFSFIRAE